jgi:hypothetical protein
MAALLSSCPWPVFRSGASEGPFLCRTPAGLRALTAVVTSADKVSVFAISETPVAEPADCQLFGAAVTIDRPHDAFLAGVRGCISSDPDVDTWKLRNLRYDLVGAGCDDGRLFNVLLIERGNGVLEDIMKGTAHATGCDLSDYRQLYAPLSRPEVWRKHITDAEHLPTAFGVLAELRGTPASLRSKYIAMCWALARGDGSAGRKRPRVDAEFYDCDDDFCASSLHPHKRTLVAASVEALSDSEPQEKRAALVEALAVSERLRESFLKADALVQFLRKQQEQLLDTMTLVLMQGPSRSAAADMVVEYTRDKLQRVVKSEELKKLAQKITTDVLPQGQVLGQLKQSYPKLIALIRDAPEGEEEEGARA